MIRKKLNNEDEPAYQSDKANLNLARKSINNRENYIEDDKNPEKSEETSIVQNSTINDTSQLAGEIIFLFGIENINSIKHSFAHLNILPGDDDDKPEEWLVNILNSYFTGPQIDNLCAHFNTAKKDNLAREAADRATISGLNNKIENVQTKLASLENSIRAQDDDLSESNRKLKNVIPGNTAFQYLCNELPQMFGNLKSLLLDDAGDDTVVKFKFILSTIRPLTVLAGFLSNDDPDKEQNMLRISGGLSYLLSSIAGLHIINRREILDKIAEVCSENTSNLVFVSPESSLVVDPAIHNAKALNGTTVKEGISYAILRRDSRQTIKLADITVI